jgi:hypothetical protein
MIGQCGKINLIFIEDSTLLGKKTLFYYQASRTSH